MKNRSLVERRVALLSSTALAGAFLFSSYAAAQEVEEIAEASETIDEIAQDDTIVVTGSRIAKKEFTSASPVQVIQGDIARELGLFNVDDILQTTPQSTGFQIDQTFGGFVLDNGPGATQVSFRGLDPERTLVLVNGRRMSPTGVGGAPTTPDLSLIPTILVERIENLFDGASSVYGSDAIAGVANVILRKDFDGFQVDADTSIPLQGGGRQFTVSASWGASNDRGFIGFGGEFQKRKPVKFGDRDFFGNCESERYIDENGNFLGLDTDNNPGVTVNECDLFPLINRISITQFGSVYYTPGRTNVGINDFSETQFGGTFDFDGDGLQDVDFKDPFYSFGSSDAAQEVNFRPDNETFSVYAYGEYQTDLPGDITPFFEMLYANRQTESRGSNGALAFPVLSGDNPFNPCNPNGIRGNNCLSFFGVSDANYLAVSQNILGFDTYPTATGILKINGDRDRRSTEVDLFRIVGGFRGELPWINDASDMLSDFNYEFSATYSRSTGFDQTPGINEQRLNLTLETSVLNPDGSITCGGPVTQEVTCVPVDFFAPNVFQEGGGNLTAEEAEYLFTSQDLRTTVEQTNIVGSVSGVVGTLPWNDSPIPIVIGGEYREDVINTIPNEIARDGLLAFRASDRGAVGGRNLYEFFFETDLDLWRDTPGIELFNVNAAARWTEESNYGSAWTYSVKGIYKPVDFLTFRGTYGTSYRAPNAREQFLAGGTGFNNITDPCIVPADARTPSDPSDPLSAPIYDGSQDDRTAFEISQCQAQGVDPFSLGITVNPARTTQLENVEVLTGGTDTLEDERSRAFTGGIVFEQPFSDAFGLTFSATYFDILVEDSIEEPTLTNVAFNCFNADGQSPDAFCSRIRRGSDGFIDLVDTSFINIGRITSRGIDYNMLITKDVEMFGRPFDISLDLRASQLLEQEKEVLGVIDDNAGETESPTWRGNANLFVSTGDFRFNWLARFIGGGEEDEPGLDFDVACPEPGPNRPLATGVQCQPIYFTGDYHIHNFSVTWAPEDLVVTAGIRNIFNRGPELVDADGVFSVRNVPIGVGYDTDGRTLFMSVRKNF